MHRDLWRREMQIGDRRKEGGLREPLREAMPGKLRLYHQAEGEGEARS